MSIEPNSTSDKDKMELNSMIEEDPTFVVLEDEETGQMISGMGELHLEIIRSPISGI